MVDEQNRLIDKIVNMRFNERLQTAFKDGFARGEGREKAKRKKEYIEIYNEVVNDLLMFLGRDYYDEWNDGGKEVVFWCRICKIAHIEKAQMTKHLLKKHRKKTGPIIKYVHISDIIKCMETKGEGK